MQGASILIVDDDASIRDLLTEWLSDEGYRPLTAANGREAITYLEESGRLPDVMLLDLLMPEVNGHDVLRYLRQNLLQEFPVLIFSAQRPDQSILEALDSELRDFVAKPFDLEELSIRMQRLLQRSPRFAATESGQLRVYTLGSLRVYRDDTLLFDESWRNKPAKTIFKLLFTNRGHRYPKDVLAEELWPETDPDAAANRLRVAVHELRKRLGDRGKRGASPGYIGQQEGAYFFAGAHDTQMVPGEGQLAPFWSDVDAFQEYLDHGHERAEGGQLEAALQAFRKAEALYQDDYLRDDPFLEWTISTRERLREAHLGMLSDAARIYAQRDDPGEAAAFCRKILRVEPWREEVYRRLMEYLVVAGRPSEALRAFEDCRRALQAEIESYPSAETVALRDRIAGGNAVRPAGK